MACLWGSLGRLPGDTWLSAVERSKLGAPETYNTDFGIYCISLYWAIATFTSIGYGDVTPQTSTEYLVVSMTMAGSAAAWAFIIGKVCTLMSTMTAHDQKFRQNMDNLNWSGQKKNYPPTTHQ
eukprot:6047171-Amphidinium_carterae.1